MPSSVMAVRNGKNDLVVVHKSSIHGKGLFARRAIEADELIGVYEGKRTDEDGPYVLWIYDDKDNLYGIDGANETRFVNHCPDANAAFYGEQLYAMRDIPAGEEITHHYGDEWHTA